MRVIISVTDETMAKNELGAVEERLKAQGLRGPQVIHSLGLIRGHVLPADRAGLSGVAGVKKVEDSQEL